MFSLPPSVTTHVGCLEQQLFGEGGFLAITLSHAERLDSDVTHFRRAKSTKEGRGDQRSIVLENGTTLAWLANGVLGFYPEKNRNCNNMLLSAAVHGNETAPIELALKLISQLISGKLSTNNSVLFVLANPPSIIAEQRFIKENMNRLFYNLDITDVVNSNRTKQKPYETEQFDLENYERLRAAQLMAITTQFFSSNHGVNLHYDMHTAIRGSFYKKFAVSPNSLKKPGLLSQFQWLKKLGIDAVLHNEKKSSTFSSFCAKHCNAIAFTLELGSVRRFGENKLSDLSTTFSQLSALISNSYDLASANRLSVESSWPRLFEVTEEVIKKSDDFELGFADSTENFSELAVGSLLAKDHEYRRFAKLGERIIFPNAMVAINQRALVIIKDANKLYERLL